MFAKTYYCRAMVKVILNAIRDIYATPTLLAHLMKPI